MVKVVNNSMATELDRQLIMASVDRQLIMASVERQPIMASPVCAKTPWDFTSFVWRVFELRLQLVF